MGFHFTQFLMPLNIFGRRSHSKPPIVHTDKTLDELPAVKQDFGKAAQWKQIWWLSIFEWKKMVTSFFYVIMCAMSIGILLLLVRFMDLMYEASTYKVTYKIVDNVEGSTLLFMLIFIIFYSGTTIWRDRETRMHELVGVTPVSNAGLFFSKIIVHAAHRGRGWNHHTTLFRFL
jgi:ABC-2 type transport system permease protein